MRFALAFIVWALCLGQARGASPAIAGLAPRAIVPGQKTKLTVSGSNLDGVTHLWTYFNAKARRITNSPNSATFEVECQGGLYPSGVWGVQAYGPGGISDFALIMIDPIAVTERSATNLSFASAQRIVPPIAVDASFASEQADYYRFEARAGQEFSVEILAHRLGSLADPVLQVLDSAGREIAYCDDEDGVWRDARLRFRAPLNGEYTLAVHDVGYGGGSGFAYRLRVGDFPMAPFRFPLGDLTEPDAGSDLDPAPGNDSPANPDTRVWYNTVPSLLEREPNEALEKLQEFSPPVIINGRFDTSNDRDLYRFAAAKDQTLAFQRQSRSLGSPCDVSLRVLRMTGEVLAATDGASADETVLKHTFDASGTYLLEARDLTGTAPARSPYRLRVRGDAPEFRLMTEVNKLEIAPDGSAKIKVTCERMGYEGEIRLEAAGLLLEENVIAAKKKEAEMTVRLPGDAPDFFHAHLTGAGTNGFKTMVSTKPALKKNFPLMLVPPNELDGKIAVGRRTK